jgi:hypothetical protein
MFAFASLLCNNLRGGEIKTEALAEVFIFQTTFRHHEGYTTNTQTKILFNSTISKYKVDFHYLRENRKYVSM